MFYKHDNGFVRLNTKFVSEFLDYNPYDLPQKTIRVKMAPGVTPDKVSHTLVDEENNIWDLTINDYTWAYYFNTKNYHSSMIEILGGNLTNVSMLSNTFFNCSALTSVKLWAPEITTIANTFSGCYNLQSISLYDSNKLTYAKGAFMNCTSLSSVKITDTSKLNNMDNMFVQCNSLVYPVPLNTSSVTSMNGMYWNCSSLGFVPNYDLRSLSPAGSVHCLGNAFNNCVNVSGGILDLYNQTKDTLTATASHQYTFKNCGINNTYGAAELAQIPSNWK